MKTKMLVIKILFTFVLLMNTFMPSYCSSSFDLDEEDLSEDHSTDGKANHPTKKMECHHFNQTSDCAKDGRCSETVICESRESEPDPACFILWENKRVRRTVSKTGETIDDFGEPVIKLKGCWSGHSAKQCSNTPECIEHRKKATKDLFFCCCRGDLCNTQFKHVLTEDSYTSGDSSDVTSMEVTRDQDTTHWILVSLASGIIFLGIVYTVWYFRFRKNNLFNPLSMAEDLLPLNDPSSPGITFGPIHSMEEKAKGRYGSVYRGKVGSSIPESLVAVKIFPIQDKSSYLTEVGVYQLPQMKHENILLFLGAERRHVGEEGGLERTEFWLVTEYHDRGSLYDYLKAHVVSYPEFLKIGQGISRGLDYLHDDQAKPTVAHRDFKSKNVLLKPDLTACIADFGLALVFKPNEAPNETLGQVGTRRYMAPEVLEGAISFSKEALLRIDMYACGLVLWELVSRCTAQDGPVSEYRLPFEEEIGTHPTLEEVQEVVCQKKQRPEIRETWRRHKGLSRMCETIEELWDQEAEARVTAANVDGRISDLICGDNRSTDLSHPDPPYLLVNHSTPPSSNVLLHIQHSQQQQPTSLHVDIDV